jgi:hypothetical protein
VCYNYIPLQGDEKMEAKNNVSYYLILEKRPGDYNVIDISKLDICREEVSNDLTYIDFFTCRFTEDEIKSSIARSNIVREDYLDGSLKVISNDNHKLRALTKDIYQIIINRVSKGSDINRDLKNRLFSYYKKTIMYNLDDNYTDEKIESFKDALRDNDFDNIFNVINNLPYLRSREMYFLIYDDELKRKEVAKRSLKADDNR